MNASFLRHIAAIACLVYPFWLGMIAVPELGHVLAAVATGGTVVRVTIPRMGFSRTDVSPNPSPRTEIWGGPILGGVLPLGVALALLRTRAGVLAMLFAG